jgi:hypothetical protein
MCDDNVAHFHAVPPGTYTACDFPECGTFTVAPSPSSQTISVTFSPAIDDTPTPDVDQPAEPPPDDPSDDTASHTIIDI